MTTYSTRVRDIPYMQWVKQQPCALDHRGECDGAVEADHAGDRPFGRKAPDYTCIPLCQRHHQQRTDSRGFFSMAFWEHKLDRRAWIVGTIYITQRTYLRMGHEFLEPGAPQPIVYSATAERIPW